MAYWSIFTAAGEPLAANVVADDAATAAGHYGADAVARQQPRALTGAALERIDFASGELIEDVEAARGWALAAIDRRRSDAIKVHLGATPEIREMHRAKSAEAAEVIAGDDVGDGLLSAEAAATGRELGEVAADVMAQAGIARAAIRTIEGQAMAAKAAVRAAMDVAAVMAAMDWGY